MARRGTALALGLLLVAFAVGCQLGPGRMKAASSHYSDAVRVASSEQLLVNLVRLRYRDLPVFLGISNISTQFEFEVDGSVTAQRGLSRASDIFTGGAGARYSERPTITFGLLGGESFQKRMLQPLDVPVIAILAESGWRGDRVLQLTVEQMNGLRNAPTASGPTPRTVPRFDDFLEATDLIEKLYFERLLHFDFRTRRETISPVVPTRLVEGDHVVAAVEAGAEFADAPGRTGAVLVVEKRKLEMRFAPHSNLSPDVLRLRELLRLRPDRMRFEVVALEDSEWDPFDETQLMSELAIDTRSLLGVLYYLSNGVQTPPEDVTGGLVTSTVEEDGDPFEWSELLDGLFRVETSESEPKNAAVVARHRGRWFFVDDADESSKSTFVLLSQLFQLQAGDVEEVKPVLTLPVGGP